MTPDEILDLYFDALEERVLYGDGSGDSLRGLLSMATPAQPTYIDKHEGPNRKHRRARNRERKVKSPQSPPKQRRE